MRESERAFNLVATAERLNLEQEQYNKKRHLDGILHQMRILFASDSNE